MTDEMSKPDSKWYPNNFDWYVKWLASILILTSLAFRAAGVEYRNFDLFFGFFGVALWLWVSIMWKDRALIILNVVSLFMLATAIIKEYA
jgi:hypothetical protein